MAWVGKVKQSLRTKTREIWGEDRYQRTLERQIKRVKDRRAAFFHGKSCIKCGSTLNLEIDHRDPKQKVTNNVWSWSLERAAQELAKCDVLCRICHMEKTINQDRPRRDHGSIQMYRVYGCRCQLCTNKVASEKFRPRDRSRVNTGRTRTWSAEDESLIMTVNGNDAAKALGIGYSAVSCRRFKIRRENPGVRYPYQDLPKPKQPKRL